MKKFYQALVVLTLSAGFSSCSGGQSVNDMPKKFLEPSATIQFSLINESSGIVKSRTYDNLFWTLNDSGNEPRIFAITRDGEIIKPESAGNYSGILVENTRNIDWEDIAIDDAGNLYIGEFGNNANRRKNLAVFVVKEPDPRRAESIPVISKIPFRYPDQTGFPPPNRNFDAEALFWIRGKLHILSKNRSDAFTKLYRFDSMKTDEENVLTLLDSFESKSMVTAADITPDGSKLAVLTYEVIWLFEVTDGSEDYFKGKISWMPMSAEQCEAIAFDGDNLLITNEQKAIFEVPLSDLVVYRK